MTENTTPNQKPASIRARLKYATEEEFIEKYSLNISKMGIFVKTDRPHAKGTRIKFEFQLTSGSAVMRGLGEVAWTREEQEGGMPCGMGIKFLKLDTHSREILGRVLKFKKIAKPAAKTSRPPADEISPLYKEAMASSAVLETPAQTDAKRVSKPADEDWAMARKRRRRPRSAEADTVDLKAINSMLAEIASETVPRKRKTGRRFRSSYPPAKFTADKPPETKAQKTKTQKPVLRAPSAPVSEAQADAKIEAEAAPDALPELDAKPDHVSDVGAWTEAESTFDFDAISNAGAPEPESDWDERAPDLDTVSDAGAPEPDTTAQETKEETSEPEIAIAPIDMASVDKTEEMGRVLEQELKSEQWDGYGATDDGSKDASNGIPDLSLLLDEEPVEEESDEEEEIDNAPADGEYISYMPEPVAPMPFGAEDREEQPDTVAPELTDDFGSLQVDKDFNGGDIEEQELFVEHSINADDLESSDAGEGTEELILDDDDVELISDTGRTEESISVVDDLIKEITRDSGIPPKTQKLLDDTGINAALDDIFTGPGKSSDKMPPETLPASAVPPDLIPARSSAPPPVTGAPKAEKIVLSEDRVLISDDFEAPLDDGESSKKSFLKKLFRS